MARIDFLENYFLAPDCFILLSVVDDIGNNESEENDKSVRHTIFEVHAPHFKLASFTRLFNNNLLQRSKVIFSSKDDYIYIHRFQFQKIFILFKRNLFTIIKNSNASFSVVGSYYRILRSDFTKCHESQGNTGGIVLGLHF